MLYSSLLLPWVIFKFSDADFGSIRCVSFCDGKEDDRHSEFRVNDLNIMNQKLSLEITDPIFQLLSEMTE